MRLSSLLASLSGDGAAHEWLRDDPSDDPAIRGISYDSRRVAPGDLFVALTGSTSDGHDYLADALALGAAALLVERDPGSVRGDRPAVVVGDTRRALAPLAVRFYGEPASECTLVGVTGTNGKTSTTYLVESILSKADFRTGLIGTIEARYAGERVPSVNTTPESLDLQRLLRSMRTQNVEAVAMEVSSHGLELGRVAGCRFRVGAFTNLTQDHLDFHGSMDAYLASKARLFRDHLGPGAAAVLNVDDPAGEKLTGIAADAGARVLRCSRRSADASAPAAELRMVSSESRLDGSRARVTVEGGRDLELHVPLLGDFNLENALVAAGIGVALGIAPEAIEAGIESCPQVPGRVELVGDASDPTLPTVVVDYAHTPDAVDKLLAAVRPLSRGRVVAVFGCGGDRDRRKRPLMAEAVVRHSDLAVATSDNPRTEDPAAILDDVREGLAGLPECELDALASHERGVAVEIDRRSAIRAAVAAARPEDTVVVAGKGHEDYQILGTEKFPFDDRKEARDALRARNE